MRNKSDGVQRGPRARHADPSLLQWRMSKTLAKTKGNGRFHVVPLYCLRDGIRKRGSPDSNEFFAGFIRKHSFSHVFWDLNIPKIAGALRAPDCFISKLSCCPLGSKYPPNFPARFARRQKSFFAAPINDQLLSAPSHAIEEMKTSQNSFFDQRPGCRPEL